jgi:flagellar FliL protein
MSEKTEGAAPKAGKKKTMLIVIIALVVLVAGGAGAFLFMGKKHAPKDGEAHEEEEVADTAKAKPPVFVTLEPFTVNLTSEASDRYLQVGIDLKVSGPEIADRIKAHLPEIRNGILLLLTSKRVDELASLEGKNLLREEIRDAVNRPIGFYNEAAAAPEGEKPARKPPKAGVLDVLLTSFVIQ